jgi:NAD+ kinase
MSRGSGVPVGVVGDHPAVVTAVETAGGEPHVGPADAVLAGDPVAVVAAGEDALVDLVTAGAAVPVLPVAAGRSVCSVPGMAVGPAVDRLVDGAFDRRELPVLSVDGVGEPDEGCEPAGGAARALLDLLLVTSEPARISEFTVRSGDERVGRFRADGVALATPAGSRGYTHAAGGPIVEPGTGVVTVVPIAPFATDADDWVLPQSGVELGVERDDSPVELLADGRSVGAVSPEEPVAVERDGTLTVAVTEESYGFYGE